MNTDKTQIPDCRDILMKELEKEWSRTGKGRVVISVREEEADRMRKVIVRGITERQQETERDDITFGECLNLIHANHILLRLARKFSRENEGAQREAHPFRAILDEEENDLLEKLLEKKDGV